MDVVLSHKSLDAHGLDFESGCSTGSPDAGVIWFSLLFT